MGEGGKLETLAKQMLIYTVQLSKQTINKMMVLSASGVIEIKAHQQSEEINIPIFSITTATNLGMMTASTRLLRDT